MTPFFNELTATENKEIRTFLKQFDWNVIIATLLKKSFYILLILLILFIARKIIFLLLDKSFENYKKKENYSESRLKTLQTLSRNSAQYLLFFFGVYAILTVAGVPVGSLVAGAGIVGIAIGLGAQGFINDVITGFFLIYERQVDVGDHVIIDSIEGTVSQVGLRTTQIKSFNGTMNYVPNRQILIVSNLSRGNIQVVVDIRINPDEDIEKIQQIMTDINKTKISNIPELRSEPTVVGLVDLGNGNFAVRATAYALSGSQFAVKTAMTTAYIETLTAQGINIPSSPMNLTV